MKIPKSSSFWGGTSPLDQAPPLRASTHLALTCHRETSPIPPPPGKSGLATPLKEKASTKDLLSTARVRWSLGRKGSREGEWCNPQNLLMELKPTSYFSLFILSIFRKKIEIRCSWHVLYRSKSHLLEILLFSSVDAIVNILYQWKKRSRLTSTSLDPYYRKSEVGLQQH